uniref:3-hydroxyacyl-CoA dehydrogenase n=1 Tax=Anopheles funestus TaxID=62324 RepID=A0A4Y0BKD0_ANOFN
MLKNAVALVTGGASGLGRATVERFARAGYNVLLCDLPTSKGNDVAKELGEKVVYVPVDVLSEKDMSGGLELAKSKFRRLDVSVNCAGIAVAGRRTNFNKKVGSQVGKISQRGSAGRTRPVRRDSFLSAGLMGENEPNADGQRGVIVNTASVAAYDGQIGQAAYSASKAAVVGMTLPIARDLSTQGSIVTVAPGLFNTPMLQALPDKVRAFLAKTVPFQRLGEPAEYAQLVQNIVDNPMLNGEVIRLDGALRMMP